MRRNQRSTSKSRMTAVIVAKGYGLTWRFWRSCSPSSSSACMDCCEKRRRKLETFIINGGARSYASFEANHRNLGSRFLTEIYHCCQYDAGVTAEFNNRPAS